MIAQTDHSQVALPPGTVSLDGWQDDDGRHYRIISGQDRRVEGIDGVVGTSAIQWDDGSVDDGRLEGPCIWIGVTAEGVAPEAARQFAHALIDAAEEVDQWVSREPKVAKQQQFSSIEVPR
jgi:hypothetical protein